MSLGQWEVPLIHEAFPSVSLATNNAVVAYISPPPVQLGRPHGLYPRALVAHAVSLVPSAAVNNFVIRLRELDSAGTVLNTVDVSFTGAANSLLTNVLQNPFQLRRNNWLQIFIPTGVTGLSGHIGIWYRLHGVDLPEQRQVFGVAPV